MQPFKKRNIKFREKIFRVREKHVMNSFKDGAFRNEYMCARVSPSSDKEIQMISCDGHLKDSAIKWEWIPADPKSGMVFRFENCSDLLLENCFSN